MILLLIQRPDKQMIVWRKVSEDVEGRCWKYVCHLILALLYNKQSKCREKSQMSSVKTRTNIKKKLVEEELH